VFQPAGMSIDQLQRGTEEAWRQVYSLPSIARRLQGTPASPWVALASNLGYRHYAHNLHRFYNCDWIIGRAPSRGSEATEPRERRRALASPRASV